MTSLAAGGGQNTLSGMHTAHILRAGLLANQNHFLTIGSPFFGALCIEDHLSAGCTGHRVDTLYQKGFFQLSRVRFVDHGIEDTFDIRGLDAQDGFFFGDELLFHHIDRNAEGCDRAALAGAALQHVELAFFYRKLEILHIAIMCFELLPNIDELFIDFRIALFEFREFDGGTDSRNDILALGIDKVIAIENVLAAVRVTGKAHAGSGGLPLVSEHHLHDVDCGSLDADKFLHFSICHRFLRHP